MWKSSFLLTKAQAKNNATGANNIFKKHLLIYLYFVIKTI